MCNCILYKYGLGLGYKNTCGCSVRILLKKHLFMFFTTLCVSSAPNLALTSKSINEAERLQAFFVAPTGLRYFPAFVRAGLATATLHRSPPFGLAPLLTTPISCFNLSAIERLQALLVSHSRLRHPPHPRLPPHLNLRSRRPRPINSLLYS